MTKISDNKKALREHKRRVVKRMKNFLAESRKMDKKFEEILAAIAELGYKITSMNLNSESQNVLNNKRKRSKFLTYLVVAEREGFKFQGHIHVKTASMKVFLARKGHWNTALKGTYYKNLKLHDNFLGAIVHSQKEIF